MKNYIAYYRVSTAEQGKSGLGLSSQKRDVEGFIQNLGGRLLAEYTDVQSGGVVERKNLQKAISECVLTGAALVVNKIDRLSRDGFKILIQLDEAGVEYIDASSPSDSDLMKEIKFSLAKDEKKKIANRTKKALDEIKKKIENGQPHISKAGNIITKLGNPENLSDEARRKATQVLMAKAQLNPANRMATALIVSMKEQGKTYAEIADTLNTNGYRTSKGFEFSVMAVSRLYKRANKFALSA